MFRATPSIHRSYGLMRQTKILRSASHFAILNSLRRLPLAPAGSWPFPTLSLRIFLHVSGPLPRLLLWCVYPFLPTELRPSQQSNPVGAQLHPYFDGAPGDVSTFGNLTCGETFLPFQSQYFIYFAHG